jgi:hypothetical protein
VDEDIEERGTPVEGIKGKKWTSHEQAPLERGGAETGRRDWHSGSILLVIPESPWTKKTEDGQSQTQTRQALVVVTAIKPRSCGVIFAESRPLRYMTTRIDVNLGEAILSRGFSFSVT